MLLDSDANWCWPVLRSSGVTVVVCGEVMIGNLPVSISEPKPCEVPANGCKPSLDSGGMSVSVRTTGVSGVVKDLSHCLLLVDCCRFSSGVWKSISSLSTP